MRRLALRPGTTCPVPMFKWLVLILLGLAVYLSLKKGRRRGPGAPAGGRNVPVERMVACAHCGVYLPLSESVGDQGDTVFCCEEHRRLGARRPS